MRWANLAEGVPFAVQQKDVAFLGAVSAVVAADNPTGSAQVQTLARAAFRARMEDQVCPPLLKHALDKHQTQTPHRAATLHIFRSNIKFYGGS